MNDIKAFAYFWDVKKMLQILTWVFFLLFFFSKERSTEIVHYISHQTKEFSFETNLDSPFHELKSDQTQPVLSFTSIFRMLNFSQNSYRSISEHSQLVFQIKIGILNSLYFSDYPTKTTQLRC